MKILGWREGLQALDASDEPRAFEVRHVDRTLIVRFKCAHRVVSWAIVGGGLGRTRSVAWLEVTDRELRPPVDPVDHVRRRLATAGVPDAVALVTSRDLGAYVDVSRSMGEVTARCVATVGLGNALRAGDPPGPTARIGTINVLAHVDVPLAENALLEALALSAEARALAIREAEVESRVSGAPASGTGTDCIVVAAPASGEGAAYAGKHTVLGALIGGVVYEATRRGADDWLRAKAEGRLGRHA